MLNLKEKLLSYRERDFWRIPVAEKLAVLIQNHLDKVESAFDYNFFINMV